MSEQHRPTNAPFRMGRRQLLSGLASSGLILSGVHHAFGQVRVPVVGEAAPLPIAIPNFVAGTPSDGEVGLGVAQVITNNLKRSGLFAPIDQAAFIEKIANIDEHKLRELRAGTFFYATLFLVEGTGLALRQRWAEYVTIVSTSSLIPLEVYELVKHYSALKIAFLLINIAVVVYLIFELRRSRRRG